jgi:hypothetical protein
VDDVELLDLWARAGARAASERAGVLAAAWADGDAEELGVGALNRVLLGACSDVVDGVADCPACGQRVEVELRPPQLLADAGAPVETLGVDLGGRRVEVRVPRAADLRAAAAADSIEEARAVLTARCLGEHEHGHVDAAAAAAVGEALDAVDPLLAPALALECTACGHGWPVLVDAGELLWSDLDARARALATEVAVLARAFAWSEAEVVALPAPRRRLYLELAG